MKVLVFADSGWSVGRVHRDVLKYLKDIEFIFIDWHMYNYSDLIKQINECDICLTNIVSISFFRDANIPIDYRKCIFMSHGYIDNDATKIDNITDEWVYGITSESIRSLFPENRKIFFMPNGVDPEQFIYKEHNGTIQTLGWCGAPNVWSKQVDWALEITNRTGIPLSIASAVPCEHDIQVWKPLTYDEVRNWYSTVDLFLITSIPESKYETGPLPAFEAIVSGVPVIGTPVGNFADVPGPKFTTIEEGVNILNSLKENPEELKQLAKDQYEYVMKHLTYQSFAHKWKEALEYVYLRSKE